MTWAPDYVTLTEAKEYLRIDDDADDMELGFAISAASRAIDRSAGRQFGAVIAAEEREFEAVYDRKKKDYVVQIDDVMNVTGLTVVSNSITVDASDYKLYPLNADKKSRPWTAIRTGRQVATVNVTAVFGWSTVPDGVKQACLLQASRFFVRKNSPLGVAGTPDMGSEMRLLNKVDPDVEVALGPYRRWWAIA